MTDNSGLVLDALPRQVEAALMAIGMTAETYAKKDCPVDTGRLRNSITFATVKDGKDGAVLIGSNVEYAPYVELGASGRKPQPFLGPAAKNHGEEYKELAEAALKST